MAQNPKENLGPQQIRLDVLSLETSTAFETGLTGEYGRLLTTELFLAAQVITACVELSPVHM